MCCVCIYRFNKLELLKIWIQFDVKISFHPQPRNIQKFISELLGFFGQLCLCNSWDKNAKLARRFWKNKKAWPYRSIFEAKHMSSPVFISGFMTYYGKIIFDTWTLSSAFFCANHLRVEIISTNLTHRRKSPTNMESGIHIKHHYIMKKMFNNFMLSNSCLEKSKIWVNLGTHNSITGFSQ